MVFRPKKKKLIGAAQDRSDRTDRTKSVGSEAAGPIPNDKELGDSAGPLYTPHCLKCQQSSRFPGKGNNRISFKKMTYSVTLLLYALHHIQSRFPATEVKYVRAVDAGRVSLRRFLPPSFPRKAPGTSPGENGESSSGSDDRSESAPRRNDVPGAPDSLAKQGRCVSLLQKSSGLPKGSGLTHFSPLITASMPGLPWRPATFGPAG